MKHIMERHDSELVKKVFLAQKNTPTQGDFVNIVEKDLKELKIIFEEVMMLSKTQLKTILKTNAKSAAFEELKSTQLTHTKVKYINYEHLEMQPYQKIHVMCNEEINTLTSFRLNCNSIVRRTRKEAFQPADRFADNAN